MEAFEKGNQLAPIFSNSNACDQALTKTTTKTEGLTVFLKSQNIWPHGGDFSRVGQSLEKFEEIWT
mgnify:CR=1 FL=1